ncbi:MAG: hypothetical protein AAGB22_13125, partial [Bacteroidota bacterium]
AGCGLNNGSVSATAVGGTAPLTYTWYSDPGLTVQVGTGTNVSGLPGGTYFVEVEDANGCSDQASVTVNSGGLLSVSLTTTDAGCGLSNGSVSATVSGGSGSFTASWFDDAGLSNLVGTGISLSGLGPGTYYVQVTDTAGCSISDSAVVMDSGVLDVVATASLSACTDTLGIAVATANGGTSPIAFAWSLTAGATTPISTNDTLSGVPPGTYYLEGTDAAGCSGRDSVEVLAGAFAIEGVVSASVTCANTCDGRLAVNVRSGRAPMTYTWSDGGTDSLSNALCIGNYGITVTDANGCTASAVVNLPEPEDEPVAGFTFGENPVSIVASPVLINNTSTFATSYTWRRDGTVFSQREAAELNLTDTGLVVIRLVVTNDRGCVDSTTQTLRVLEEFFVWMPNAFSPIGDQKNDRFGPVTNTGQLDNYQLTI